MVTKGWRASRSQVVASSSVVVIKSMPGFERVPILALTANVMRGDKEKTLEAGCDGYIQKPLDIDQLVREVERFLLRRNNA